MGLETNFNGVDDLNQSWPTNAADPVSEGANHLRGIKKSLQGGFGGNGTYADQKFTGAVVTRTVAAGMSWLLSSIERGRITVTAASEMFIEASSASGVLGLRAKDSGGITRPVWVLTALAAGSQLYHAAAAVLTTLTNGVAVRSGAGADPVLGFQTATGVDRGNVTGAAAGITIAALTGTAVNLGPVGAAPVAVGVSTMSAAGRTVTNAADPANPQDLVTKAYVDSRNPLGFKVLASGQIGAAGAIVKQKGCTVTKRSTGIFDVVIASAASAAGNAIMQVTPAAPAGTSPPMVSGNILTTTTAEIATWTGGSSPTPADGRCSFIVWDLGA